MVLAAFALWLDLISKVFSNRNDSTQTTVWRNEALKGELVEPNARKPGLIEISVGRECPVTLPVLFCPKKVDGGDPYELQPQRRRRHRLRGSDLRVGRARRAPDLQQREFLRGTPNSVMSSAFLLAQEGLCSPGPRLSHPPAPQEPRGLSFPRFVSF